MCWHRNLHTRELSWALAGLVTWQLVGGVVVRPVVLDERRDRRDVAGVHGRHAGSSADRGGLVVQVQHPEGRRKWGGGASVFSFWNIWNQTHTQRKIKATLPYWQRGKKKKKTIYTKKEKFLTTKEPDIWWFDFDQPQIWAKPLETLS